MGITWSKLIQIVEEMFDIKPEDIAKQLGVDASTIARLKSGETGRLTARTLDEVYTILFGPTNAPIKLKANEKELLSLLKSAIETVGVQEFMSDMWNREDDYEKGEYEVFVRSMLKRVTSNHHNDRTSDYRTDYSADENDDFVMPNMDICEHVERNDNVRTWIHELVEQSQNNYLINENVIKIKSTFEQSIDKYHINDYIKSTNGISKSKLVADIKSFYDSINRRILKRPAESIDEYIVIAEIERFLHMLANYFAPPDSTFSHFSPCFCEIDQERHRLISLLLEIADSDKSTSTSSSAHE